MNHSKSGFTIILVLITLLLIGIMATWYFTSSNETQQSNFEAGQTGIEQAKDINKKSYEQSQQINEQLELQNDINAQ